MSTKEIEENLENQVKAQELQNMSKHQNDKDTIAMFNKRVAKAETEKAMKKVSQSLLKIKQQEPSMLEKIYQ